MNSVGIDISKGRSTVAVMRPFGEVVISPFEVRHTDSELSELARQLKSLDGETRVVMEATGNYHAPVAKLLYDAGLYVSVVNAKLVHGYGAETNTQASDNLQDPRGRPRGGRAQPSIPAILCAASCQAASRGNRKRRRYPERYFPCGAACESYKQRRIRVVEYDALDEVAYRVGLLTLNFPRRFLIQAQSDAAHHSQHFYSAAVPSSVPPLG